jgi:hypothetical protein
MELVERTPTRLVLRDRPWLVWAVGGLFVAAGLFVVLTSSERLFGLAFVGLGLVALATGGRTVTCTFDREAALFRRESRGWPARRPVEHPLGEVVGVRVAQGGAGRRPTYRVELVLGGGRRAPLTSAYSSGHGDKAATAALVRDFLGLPDTPDLPPPGLRELVDMLRSRPD